MAGRRQARLPGFRYAMPEQLGDLRAAMERHGYPADAVRAILGGNYLRICETVWT